MRRRSFLYGSLAIAAVGLLAACGEDPPTKPSPPGTSPFAAIQVMGPDSVLAGQSAQFVANIRQADGTTKSATGMPNLRWASSKPWVLSVSSSGMVTASWSAYGEAVITADLTNQTAVRGTRDVEVGPAVTGTLDVSQSGTEPDRVSYVFALKLTESAGVPWTVTEVWISDGGGGEVCSWTPYKLGQTRLPANGTLALDPLTCGDFYQKLFYVSVFIILTDDNGHLTYVDLYRVL
jgi:hypothetical protein